MPCKKRQFANNEIYHLVLHGLDNNLIFKDQDDYYRGLFSIYEFNNAKSIKIRDRRKARMKAKKKENALEIDMRERLVDILAFCFMPNHIHLLVKQLTEGGITKFMRKLGTGYGTYFNKKYRRRGHVFQNRFSSVFIKDDTQLKIIFVYIHANPASLVEANLNEKGINNPQKILKFLTQYKWSSYRDYLFKKNFPSVTEREFILNKINGREGCKKAVASWIIYKTETQKFPYLDNLALEPTHDGPM